MRVVVCEPNQVPQVKHIPNSLQSMQETVGGYIKVTPLPRPPGTGPPGIIVVCDKEELLKDLPPNRLGIAGTFFITRIVDEEFIGLTPNEARSVADYLTRTTPVRGQRMRTIDQLNQLLEAQIEDVSNWPKVTPVIEPSTKTSGLNLVLYEQQVGFVFSADGEKFLGVFNWKD